VGWHLEHVIGHVGRVLVEMIDQPAYEAVL
jgi:hypothetical protein